MKNAHAVALGRLGGRKGGVARSARMLPNRRREIGKLAAAARWNGRLPELLRPLFWSYRFDDLRLPGERDLVMLHVLTYGNTRQKKWLKQRFGNEEICRWIASREGRGLTTAQMSPWIPASRVRSWQAQNSGDQIWENR